jgi:hypothetical protein
VLGEILFGGSFDSAGREGHLGSFQIDVTIARNANNDEFAGSIEPGESEYDVLEGVC